MVAAGYAEVGNNELAQRWLERTLAEHDGGIISLPCNPAFDGVRSEAWFRQLLKSIRLE